MASKTWVWMLMAILSGLMGSLEGYEFKVGGKKGWVLNPSESYDQWSHRMRFQVNDTLFFKYNKGTDSVLLVNKPDYDTCNTQNPIMKMDGGDSVFKFDRSGPLYFISGNKDSCGKGQKLTLVVMAVRNIKKTTPPPTAGSQPPVTQTPATSPTQASPPLSPLPSTVSPTPSTVISPTPAKSPATMMSPTPAKSPATMMSPTPANSPTTMMSPTPANSPMMSPTAAKSPGTMISPTPANSPATMMSPTPANSPTTTMSPTPANSPSTTMSPPAPPAMSPATSPGMTPATSTPTPDSNTAAPESSPSFVPAFTPPSFTVLLLSVALGGFVAAPWEIMGIF